MEGKKFKNQKKHNKNRNSTCVCKIQGVLVLPVKEFLAALLYLSKNNKQCPKNIVGTHGGKVFLRVNPNQYLNFQFSAVCACLLRVTIVSKDFSDL